MIYEFELTTDVQKKAFKEWLDNNDMFLSSFPDENNIYYAENGGKKGLKAMGNYVLDVKYNYGEFTTQIRLDIEEKRVNV